MKRLLLLVLACHISGSFTSAEDAGCPCLTTDGGGLDVYKQSGQLYYDGVYAYPNDYGTAGCKAYDTDPSPLQPFCGNATSLLPDAPPWCFDQFCYVDPDNCSFRPSLSGIFPDSGLMYSYETCGGESTFESWFGTDGTGSSTFNLDDLADIVEQYIASLRRDIEDTYLELASVTTSCPNSHDGCTCTDCVLTAGWGTGVSVDFDATMLKPHATTPVSARSSCLSETMHHFFMKIAGTEYHDTSDFANLYGGFQEDGALSMYPEFSWCPTDYDPRFRPWYSTAATNPKLLIVVIDVSGSMGTANRIGLAEDAALAVLDTLTWNDEVGFILFNSGLEAVYPITACTDANRITMKAWASANILAGGGTNFVTPLAEAFDMIESSSSTACTKAILFLTDGVALFGAGDYDMVEQKAATNDVIMFTYALGSGADTEVAKRIACDNLGIFYHVADGSDLSEVMSSYYSYFAASISYTGARWILYDDFATGTELLAACTPMYDHTNPSEEMAILIGVICMDINMIVDTTRLRAHSQWNDLYSRVLATSQACAVSWDGMTDAAKLLVLEELRTLNANNGAETCGNAGAGDDDDGGGGGGLAGLIVGIVIPLVVVLAVCCFCYAKRGKAATVEQVQSAAGARNTQPRVQPAPQSQPQPPQPQQQHPQQQVPVQVVVQQQAPQPQYVQVPQQVQYMQPQPQQGQFVQPHTQYVQPQQQTQYMQPQQGQPMYPSY